MENNIYSDDYMINKVYSELNNIRNKTETGISKLKLKKLEIKTENKKTYVLNFRDFCGAIGRTELEVQLFLGGEFNCKTSIDSTGILIISNMYRTNVVQSCVEKYINIYVLCEQCKSKDTLLSKEKSYTYIECKNCKSKKCI
jgi:translation initiation factor 2 beta subunit (eIF-2beta)/eIF-5